jgi:hypothetical protein
VPPLSESRTPPVADLRSCVLLHVRGGAETTYGYGINYARGAGGLLRSSREEFFSDSDVISGYCISTTVKRDGAPRSVCCVPGAASSRHVRRLLGTIPVM